MKLIVALVLTTGVGMSLARAEAPATSPQPEPRANSQAVVTRAPTPISAVDIAVALAATPLAPQPAATTRPKPRGGDFAVNRVEADAVLEVTRQVTRVHYGALDRPEEKPPHPLGETAAVPAVLIVPATPSTARPEARPVGFGNLFRRGDGGNYSPVGAICGVNAIKGSPAGNVGRPGSACGIENAVKVTEVSGVRLNVPATVDCTTAKALNAWVEKGLKPAIGRRGGGVQQITIAASYACRTRNNIPGGKLSEHAKGHAIDVSGIVLKDGKLITVLDGWRSRRDGKALRSMHKAACGPFGTVLGPNADRYHQNHFHFDTARYRSGAYCE